MRVLAAATTVQLLCCSAVGLGSGASSRGQRRPFTPAEFQALKQELHTLSPADADRRFAEVEPLPSPPPRQDKIDHVVVLFMENRAFDHILGCLVGDKPGADGVPPGGMIIPKDPKNASCCAAPICAMNQSDPGCVACCGSGYTNATCGKGQLVCTSGGGFSIFGGHIDGELSSWPYGKQGVGYGVPSSVSSFNQTQLPVKKAVVDEFSVMNRYFVSVPSASTPNHLFAQSATSCGIHDNIMYSECQGPTDTFPQLTIYDSLFLHNVSFGLYMNSSCGLKGQNASKACRAMAPGSDPGEFGSPVNVPDVAMAGIGRYKDHFHSQATFYEQAARGSLPALSWFCPAAQECDHPCYDLAKGDRLLKDVYEALRAGPAWQKTMLVVVYDDTGGWFDQVIPPHVDVPNDRAPCNVNVSSKCGSSAPFDFKRLGQRSAAMLISPLVRKGAVHQHPSCSSKYKDGPFDGVCADGGKSAGSDHGGAQFEHSSLPATVKSLFNLSHFLTERDAWAGDLSELLTEPSPRTDTPLHFPDAHTPQKPFLPPFPIPGTPPPPPPAGWWRAFGPPYCNASIVSNATVSMASSASERSDTLDDGVLGVTPLPLACALYIEGNLCDDHDDHGHMIGTAGKSTHTIAECFNWCNETAGCQHFGFGSTGWCIRYTGDCTPRESPDPRYNVYTMSRHTRMAVATEATEVRRRLTAADLPTTSSTGVLQLHCSTQRHSRAGGNSLSIDPAHHCPALTGSGPNNKQRNQMAVLGMLTDQGLPDDETLAGMDQTAASVWIEKQWISYMIGGTDSGR